MGEWGKAQIARIPSHVAIVLILVLSSTAAFGLGVLAGRDAGPSVGGEEGFWIEDRAPLTEPLGSRVFPGALPAAALAPLTGTEGKGFVASKTGTKYYLPTCSGAGRIKEENKVWYATKEDAEASGLSPAANCKGL